MTNSKEYTGKVNGTVVSKSNSYRIITINEIGRASCRERV